MMAAAAACPSVTPLVFAGPSGIAASAAAYEASASAIPAARHSGDSGSVAMTETRTARAEAATAASTDVGVLACASKAYGRERRSMALTASWMATCTIAYIRDSTRPFPLMCRQAAVAAFAAFSFHVITASAAVAGLGDETSRPTDRHTPPTTVFFIQDLRVRVAPGTRDTTTQKNVSCRMMNARASRFQLTAPKTILNRQPQRNQ